MKLKLIAAVVGLALSAASQAQIIPPSTVGGSDLLLDVWEQGASNGAPDQSFTLNLNETLSQFVASASTSSTLATLLSTDSTWTGFLSSSSPVAGDLQWSVIASGNRVPTTASFLASVTTGEDPTQTGVTNGELNPANTQLATTIANLNVSGASNVNEQVNTVASNAYYQTYSLGNFNSYAWDNGNNLGTTGVEIAQASQSSRSSPAAATIAVLPGTLSFVQNAATGNYVLSYNVAAVPEAPGFGMALAGIAVLGFLALRRKNA
jgi:hypothetical protein